MSQHKYIVDFRTIPEEAREKYRSLLSDVSEVGLLPVKIPYLYCCFFDESLNPEAQYQLPEGLLRRVP